MRLLFSRFDGDVAQMGGGRRALARAGIGNRGAKGVVVYDSMLKERENVMAKECRSEGSASMWWCLRALEDSLASKGRNGSEARWFTGVRHVQAQVLRLGTWPFRKSGGVMTMTMTRE